MDSRADKKFEEVQNWLQTTLKKRKTETKNSTRPIKLNSSARDRQVKHMRIEFDRSTSQVRVTSQVKFSFFFLVVLFLIAV